jgi:hypothetical protein
MAEPLRKMLQLDSMQYYETHLNLINCLLPVRLTIPGTDKPMPNEGKFTPTEIKVLAAFMSLEGDLIKYRFGTTGRKIVKENLKLSSAGMSNYIGTMKEKGFLIEKGDLLDIWPILIPGKDEQMYMFKLINKEYGTTVSVT